VHVVLAISESGKELLYPKLSELILGAVAFFILFAFMYKWVIPRFNQLLTARQEAIQGDLEKAEETRHEAERQLAEYRESLAGARDEANRIIEEARSTAESMRRDLQAKAEQEYQGIVARAQEEIRAERDRVFQELRAQVGALSVELAGRIVGKELDQQRHLELVDDYISQLSELPSNGNGKH